MPTTTGYFEDDGADIQQKESLAGEVDMEFELDVNGDIMPRTAEANPVFPAQGNVLVAEDSWGWAGEYAGTFDEAARNTDPGIFNVLAPTAYKIQNANLTGTATGETHTADQVLKSAGGNYNDDNLSVGNIRPVAFGLSQTGTLANLAPTDMAFLTLEAERNTDMAEARVESAYEYLSRGDARTGTLTGGGGDPFVPSGVRIVDLCEELAQYLNDSVLDSPYAVRAYTPDIDGAELSSPAVYVRPAPGAFGQINIGTSAAQIDLHLHVALIMPATADADVDTALGILQDIEEGTREKRLSGYARLSTECPITLDDEAYRERHLFRGMLVLTYRGVE